MPTRALSDSSVPSRSRPWPRLGFFPHRWPDRGGDNIIDATWCRCAKVLIAAFLVFSAGSARAIDIVVVSQEVLRIDLSTTTDRYDGIGPKLTLEDEAGGSPVIEVEAGAGNTDPAWAVFSLKNTSQDPLRRWIIVNNSGSADSGFFWPHVTGKRVLGIVATGDAVTRAIRSGPVDIYELELKPDQAVTYVMEISGRPPDRLTLWDPDTYEANTRSLSLFHGLLIGILGLLAILMSSLFVVRRRAMYPAAALSGWAALAVLGAEFGIWQSGIGISSQMNGSIRAIGELLFAGAMAGLLYTFLELGSRLIWAIRMMLLLSVTIVLLSIAAVFFPAQIAGVARIVGFAVTAFGLVVVAGYALKGSSRAISLLPGWLALTAFSVLSAVVFAGALDPDVAPPLYVAGIVLVVMISSFTVLQYAFSVDVTGEGKTSELGLRAVAFSATGLSIWDWSVTDEEINVGREVATALGLPEGSLDGSQDRWLEHVHQLDKDRFIYAANAAVARPEGSLDIEIRMRTSIGTQRWYHLRARSVAREGKLATRFIGSLQEITAEKLSRERLLRDAVHDALTGLPNRALMFDRLSRAINAVKSGSRGARKPSVFVIDIDRFKNVNDSFGHAIGDSIITIIAQRLSELVDPQDTLARVQGDQFVLAVTSTARPGDLEGCAAELRQRLNEPIYVGEQEVFLTGSIGFATFDETLQSTAEELVRAAELAMVHAKSKGFDSIEIYRPEMQSERTSRARLEADLRRALERKEIELRYQPIMDLVHERVVGFEALMRWKHPEHGELAPDEFIEMAEELGVIVELGHYALDAAARQLANWIRAFTMEQQIFVSVNVSSRQIFRQDLMRDVRLIMSRADIPPGSLRLEITESLVMENPELATYVLERIHAMGAGLSLDDFGTGYSALGYLQRFPFDTLKVDKSFVAGAAAGGSPVILKSIIGLAHDLGMKVVAEGIESESDVTRLRDMGCQYGQGFFYARPLDPKSAIEFLAEWK